MVVDDLAAGGCGGSCGSVAAWGHRRVYSNRLPGNTDFGNGYHWVVEQLPVLLREDATTIMVLFEPIRAFWFDESGGQFTVRYGGKQTLSYSAQDGTYTFTEPNGTVWEFYDFDANDMLPDGLFKRRTAPGGQTVEVYACTAERITETRLKPAADGDAYESYQYTYYSSGDNTGRLQYVTLKRYADSSWTNVRRVEYEYYGSGEDHGLRGDLKTAVRKDWDGESWTGNDTCYYRYYKDAAGGVGFAHGLKFALLPQAFKALDDAVEDPFTASDSTVANYACYYFEYNADRRVTKEKLFGQSREYSFAYSDGTHDDGYNHWKRKTVESWTDSGQTVTQTVYTNYIGQVLLKELQSGNSSWVEYFEYGTDVHNRGQVVLEARPSAVAS
jgi:hypothetical protein